MQYENSGLDKSKELFEIAFRTRLSEWLFVSETDIRMDLLYENFHTGVDFHIQNNWLDQLAVHVSYSETLVPSLLFEKSWDMGEMAAFSISNYPYLRRTSLFDYHEEIPFALLTDIEYAGQIPLNAFVRFTVFNPLEIELYLNSSLEKNYYYFDRFMGSWIVDDAWKHSVNAGIGKQIDKFRVDMGTQFIFSSKLVDADIRIPWIPHLVNDFSLGYKHKKFATKGELSILMNRYDAYNNPAETRKQETLKKKFLPILSSYNSWDVSRNFKLTLDIKNFLNQKYTRIPGLPNEEMTLQMGVRLLF
jgi:hypothetical protein